MCIRDRAYRKLAMKYHPDVSDAPDAAEKFKPVSYTHLDVYKRQIGDSAKKPNTARMSPQMPAEKW